MGFICVKMGFMPVVNSLILQKIHEEDDSDFAGGLYLTGYDRLCYSLNCLKFNFCLVMSKQYYTISEAVQIFDVSEKTLRRGIKKNKYGRKERSTGLWLLDRVFLANEYEKRESDQGMTGQNVTGHDRSEELKGIAYQLGNVLDTLKQEQKLLQSARGEVDKLRDEKDSLKDAMTGQKDDFQNKLVQRGYIIMVLSFCLVFMVVVAWVSMNSAQ